MALKIFGRVYTDLELTAIQFKNFPENNSLLGSVKIKTTRNCNLKCAFCERGRSSQEDRLKIKHFRKLFRDIKRLQGKKIHLTGGEFFLRPDYKAILDMAAEKNLHIAITSNGTLIDKKISKTLAPYPIKNIQISLDSFLPKRHDKIRGEEGAFAKSSQAFLNLQENAPAIRINLNVVATRHFYQETELFLKFMQTFTPSGIHLLPLKGVQANNPLLPRLEDVIFFNQKILPKLKKILPQIKHTSYWKSIYPYGENREEISSTLSSLDYSHEFYRGNMCLAPWTHSFIHDEGKVSFCCHRPIWIGNIRKEDFYNIFTSSEYIQARGRMLRKKYPACARCEMFQKENLEAGKEMNLHTNDKSALIL